MLRCDPVDFTVPCREYEGDCASASPARTLHTLPHARLAPPCACAAGCVTLRSLPRSTAKPRLSPPPLPSDLPSQFAELPGLGLADWQCMQFPADTPVDNIVCSLLLVALMLPIKLVVMRMMVLANEAEYPDQARAAPNDTRTQERVQ